MSNLVGNLDLFGVWHPLEPAPANVKMEKGLHRSLCMHEPLVLKYERGRAKTGLRVPTHRLRGTQEGRKQCCSWLRIRRLCNLGWVLVPQTVRQKPCMGKEKGTKGGGCGTVEGAKLRAFQVAHSCTLLSATSWRYSSVMQECCVRQNLNRR